MALDPAAAATSFGSWVKKHWIAFVVGFLAVFALLIRYRNDLANKMSGLPASVKTWLKIGGFVVPVGFALLHGSAVFAATACCAVGAKGAFGAWLASHGTLAAIVGPLAALLGTIGIGLVAGSGAEDTLDLEDSQSGRIITFTPGATALEKSLFVNVHRSLAADGAPLLATSITVKVVTTVTNPAPGAGVNAIADDDLARIVESISIESPVLGTLLDKTTGQGPVLDLLVSFLGLGFNNNGDQGAAVATGTTLKITKYFTFPLATAFLPDPLVTAQYLKSLDKTEIKVRIAPTTCLGPVSAGATIGGADSTITGVVNYVPHSHWFRPSVSYFRLDTPASGSDGLTFRNFGDKGPRCSVQADRVSTIQQVSNLKGLPGNTTIDNITRILAPQLGLDDVQNVEELFMARVRAQTLGMTGHINPADGGNWAQGTTNVAGGMALADALALNLLQAAIGQKPSNMRLQLPGSEIKIREEFGTPRTGADAFLIHSVRGMSDDYVRAISKLYGGQVPLGGATPARRMVSQSA